MGHNWEREYPAAVWASYGFPAKIAALGLGDALDAFCLYVSLPLFGNTNNAFDLKDNTRILQ